MGLHASYIDVPLGWQPLGGRSFLIQSQPRATAQLGPPIALPRHLFAAADELFRYELPPQATAIVTGDASLTTTEGQPLRLLAVDVFVDERWIEHRWGAFFEADGEVAVLYVRCEGPLNDPTELLDAALSARCRLPTTSALLLER
jgi:hypothetical protein